MSSRRKFLHEMDREEVFNVGKRLMLFLTEEDDEATLPTEQMIERIESFYDEVPPEEFRRLLGHRNIQTLQKMQGRLKKHGYVLQLAGLGEDMVTLFTDLWAMGLARGKTPELANDRFSYVFPLNGEDRDFTVCFDPYPFSRIKGISEDEMRHLESEESFFSLIHGYLLVWGIAPLDVLLESISSRYVQLDEVTGRRIVMDIIGTRLGMNSILEDEDGQVLLRAREAYGCESVANALHTHLWDALPYYEPDTDELNCALNYYSADLDRGEYYYINYVDTSKKAPPFVKPEEEGGADWETLCRRHLMASENGPDMYARLTLAQSMTLEGRTIDAMALLMYNLQRYEEKDQKLFERLCRELVDNWPQWRYKGWTYAEVFDTTELTDRARTSILDACTASETREPSFRDMCPCGSGKLYGHCHARAE